MRKYFYTKKYYLILLLYFILLNFFYSKSTKISSILFNLFHDGNELWRRRRAGTGYLYD